MNFKRISKDLLFYFIFGVIAFIFDIGFLIFLVEKTEVYYLNAVIIAFISARTLNYLFNRKVIFKKSKNNHTKEYFLFLYFSFIAMILTIGFMKFFVDFLEIEYFFSKIIISIPLGFLSFLCHYNITFKKESNKN